MSKEHADSADKDAPEPHSHMTRDIKPKGRCPACDRFWANIGTRPIASDEAHHD